MFLSLQKPVLCNSIIKIKKGTFQLRNIPFLGVVLVFKGYSTINLVLCLAPLLFQVTMEGPFLAFSKHHWFLYNSSCLYSMNFLRKNEKN